MKHAITTMIKNEAMLWTLHNRACEVRRADAFLHDPDCVRIDISASTTTRCAASVDRMTHIQCTRTCSMQNSSRGWPRNWRLSLSHNFD